MEIRPLALDEVMTLIGWAGSEGWNPGLDDAAPFISADPAGFLGGFVDGEMVSGISAVRYGGDFGFIGLYICRADMRGRGYGKQVWDASMRHLDGRTIGLDGVPEQQSNYASMGFRPVYETMRWSGLLEADALGAAGIATVPIDAALVPAIIDFDALFFPAPRPGFVRPWVSSPRVARVVVRDQAIAGYAVARRCRDGFKIGPLFADDLDVARALLADLVSSCGQEVLHLDVPDTNAAFSVLLATCGMQRGFVTARMYRSTAPQVRQNGVFAVTTLELG